MIDKFPTLVYKGYGPHSRDGGTYDFAPAVDEQELSARFSDGWHTTLPEAINAHDNPDAANDLAPPTRKELEAKAKELGIKSNGRTTDVELRDAIAKALAKG